jgi:hypothetical protein
LHRIRKDLFFTNLFRKYLKINKMPYTFTSTNGKRETWYTKSEMQKIMNFISIQSVYNAIIDGRLETRAFNKRETLVRKKQ